MSWPWQDARWSCQRVSSTSWESHPRGSRRTRSRRRRRQEERGPATNPAVAPAAGSRHPLRKTIDVVVGGWTEGEGRRTGTIGALILGVPEPGGLRFVGNVGTGFKVQRCGAAAAPGPARRTRSIGEPLRATGAPGLRPPATPAGVWARDVWARRYGPAAREARYDRARHVLRRHAGHCPVEGCDVDRQDGGTGPSGSTGPAWTIFTPRCAPSPQQDFPSQLGSKGQTHNQGRRLGGSTPRRAVPDRRWAVTATVRHLIAGAHPPEDSEQSSPNGPGRGVAPREPEELPCPTNPPASRSARNPASR